MDNKITKSRLSSLFSYEWLKIVAFFVVAILLFELLFAVTGVKLTAGQQFKVIYDENIDTNFENNLIKAVCIDANNQSILSYDVQKVDAEVMKKSTDNAIDVRYQTRDSDVVISHTQKDDEGYVRAKQLLDYFEVWAFEDVLEDGEEYLSQFLTDGKTDVYSFENLDTSKIDAHFLQTHKKDNRFRSKENREAGKVRERERIKNIVSDLNDVKRLLAEHPEIFYRYRKYEQVFSKLTPDAGRYEEIKNNYERSTEKSYAIIPDKLTKGIYKVSDYFTVEGKTQDVVIMAYDFYGEEPNLQFEALRFMVSLVRNFSDFLN